MKECPCVGCEGIEDTLFNTPTEAPSVKEDATQEPDYEESLGGDEVDYTSFV